VNLNVNIERKPSKKKKSRAAVTGASPAKFGFDAGEFASQEFLSKCRCYKHYDKYIRYLNRSAPDACSDISFVKEALTLANRDVLRGGVILEKFRHLRETSSTVMRILTFDGQIIAATIHDSVLELFIKEQEKLHGLPN